MPQKPKELWKLDRSGSSDAAESGAAPLGSGDENLQTVGATLRRCREERGEDLRYVAQVLRIRYPYLKAIEDGLIEELPGPTYAVGFVRTYADHLGLDSEGLVARFKAEVQGLNARADLHFPAPLPEGKVPSGAILLVAVILAASVYGAWIYLSSEDQQVAEAVPPLPTQISEIIKGTPAGSASEPAPATGQVAAAPGGETPDPAAPAGQAEEGTPAAGETSLATAPTGEMSDAVPETEQTAEPALSQPSLSSPEQVAEPSQTRDPAEAAGPVEQATPESSPSQPDAATLPVSPPATAELPAAAEPHSVAHTEAPQQLASTPATESGTDGIGAASTVVDAPQAEQANAVYGSDNANARIVVQAIADSWVEVRDSETDELLLTRVLFKGDSFRVPDRSGLTLLTGNAGGLRIVVDGEEVPAIGPPGAVRRDIALEPDRLRAGGDAGSSQLGAPGTSNE